MRTPSLRAAWMWLALPLLSAAVGAAMGPSERPQETPAEVPEAAAAASSAASDGWDSLVPRADEIMARYDCLACHAPDSALRDRLYPNAAPTLKGITKRSRTVWLKDFLQDPRGSRPGTHHPHQLIAFPDQARGQVAEDIVHFLARADGEGAREIKPYSTDASVLERGRQLFHSVGCVVCHGPQEPEFDLEYSLAELQSFDEVEDEFVEEDEEESVPVRPGVLEPKWTPLPEDLIFKSGPLQLAAYLFDPVAQRPSGHCPSMSLSRDESIAVASYLLRRQAQRADGSFESKSGLLVQAFELNVQGDRTFAMLDRETPKASSIAREINVEPATRDNNFALRFTGWIDVPADGRYTFHLRSDDGSRLYINGDKIVDNGGTHPPQDRSGSVELAEGLQSIRVDFYESGGGEELSLQWEGPDLPKGGVDPSRFSHWSLEYRTIGEDGLATVDQPFVVDPMRADRGGQAFVQLGCVSCHSVEGAPQAAAPKVPSLERLAGVRPGVLVCLRQDGRYDLDGGDVGPLLAAFVSPESIAVDATVPAESVKRQLARRNCYGCHRRDGIGGVHPAVMPFFTGDEDAELGDQGRFPPTLTAVGRKFRPEVLRDALHGHERVRPYLNTRMPKVGDGNLDPLAASLESADVSEASVEMDAAFCGAAAVDDGRRLAGDRGGLGCVQCHDFRGTASLGVRAVDLGQMHRRLRFGWFRELLLDPSNVDLDGRMANLWIDGRSPVENLAGGDKEEQIKSLWCWLSEGGDSMAPPPGLDTGEWAFEVSPDTRTRIVSVFMEGVSPRTICIGTPEGVHAAYDLESGRVAKLWRGRFINALGTWRGRAGALEKPGSKDGLDMPSGPTVALLDGLRTPWPKSASSQPIGRTLGKDGSVTMMHRMGKLVIHETLRPTEIGIRVSTDQPIDKRRGIERTIVVRAPGTGVGSPVIARIGEARRFDRAGRGLWRMNGKQWPLFQIDEASLQAAAVVTPVRDKSDLKGPSVLDARERNDGLGAPLPVLEELRIPILLTPADDGSGELVGTISWKFAW